jgi:hypothetical protein
MTSFKVTAERYIGGKSEFLRDKKGEIQVDDKRNKIIIFNSKVIDKGESVIIQSDVSPSVQAIAEAFKSQLGKSVKVCLSTDFFKIEKE